MISLIEMWRDLSAKYDAGEYRREEEHRFIEHLTFSSAEELKGLLTYVYEDDMMGMPTWLRNLAFRLACLLEPDNAEIRRAAAFDLRLFGPDWDDEADRLDAEADAIESS